jgi:drug/metabolite transporter (DMT)-like permease
MFYFCAMPHLDKDIVKYNLLLHVVVLILGFTAILGKLISLPAYELVWYRMMIAFAALGLITLFKRQSLALPLKDILALSAIGIIIAVHWICFFQAIKVSNVSVALGCLSVGTLFTSIMEPLIQKRKISLVEVAIGFVIILGIYIIFRFETRYMLGIVYTIFASLFSSLFSVLNKQVALKYKPDVTAFWEMLSGFVCLSIFLFAAKDYADIQLSLTTNDLIFLLLLGIICTAFAFAATVKIMQKLSAYQVVLAINLEPIYGILAAYFIFGESEHMSSGFYLGATIILVSVIAYTFYKSRRSIKLQ